MITVCHEGACPIPLVWPSGQGLLSCSNRDLSGGQGKWPPQQEDPTIPSSRTGPKPWSPGELFRPSLSFWQTRFKWARGGPQPQARKGRKAGGGWMAEKSQEHENGEPQKTYESLAQKLGR